MVKKNHLRHRNIDFRCSKEYKQIRNMFLCVKINYTQQVKNNKNLREGVICFMHLFINAYFCV
jgi:hypothetical protein